MSTENNATGNKNINPLGDASGLRIEPYTEEITTDAQLEKAMAITEAFVQGAIEDGRSGASRPPEENIEAILAYMQKTHQETFSFAPVGMLRSYDEIDEAEPLLAAAYAGQAEQFDELLAANDDVDLLFEEETLFDPEELAAQAEKSNLLQQLADLVGGFFSYDIEPTGASDGQDADTQAMSSETQQLFLDMASLVDVGIVRDVEDLEERIGEELAEINIERILAAYYQNPTEREIEVMRANLSSEVFGLVHARILAQQTDQSSFDFAARDEEQSREALLSAEWHRQQQWAQVALLYPPGRPSLIDTAGQLIKAGHLEAGTALMERAAVHERLKYEHIAAAAQLERAALGIDWNHVPKWMRKFKQSTGQAAGQ